MALKTINKHCISETAIRRFQQEAQTSFHISHPNVIDVTDFGLLDDDTPFLVMELLQGETLGDRIKRAGSISVEDAIDIFIPACFGLAHAHDLGIVHRDIKPNNIMLLSNHKLGDEGSVKIVDFGIAKYSAREGGEVQALTRTGEIFGSPLYMSPEQCAGESVDHRSDIYSLGCVVFEALTGQPPCVGNTALTTMMKHISAPIPRLSDVAPDKTFPPELEAVVAKMLSKEVNHRYSNLGVVAYDLAALKSAKQAGSAKAAPAKTHHSRQSEGIRITKQAFAGTLSAIALVTAVITFSLIYMLGPEIDKLVGKQPVNESAQDNDMSFATTSPKKVGDVDVGKCDAESIRRTMKNNLTASMKLRACDITADGIEELGKQSQLTLLDLRGAQLPIENLTPLSKLKLETLEVSGTNINDAGLTQIMPQPNLRCLHAAQTDITDASVAEIANLPKMENLNLSAAKITDGGLAKLEKSPIRWLALNHCRKVTDAGIRSLEDSSIENLELSDVNLTEKSLKYLNAFKRLKHLDLGNSQFMFDDIENFCKHTKIKEVYLKHCPFLGKAEQDKLQAEFPDISFFNNHRIKDHTLEHGDDQK